MLLLLLDLHHLLVCVFSSSICSSFSFHLFLLSVSPVVWFSCSFIYFVPIFLHHRNLLCYYSSPALSFFALMTFDLLWLSFLLLYSPETILYIFDEETSCTRVLIFFRKSCLETKDLLEDHDVIMSMILRRCLVNQNSLITLFKSTKKRKTGN